MILSCLDLSVQLPNCSRHQAFWASIELANYAESLGYHRFLVAEHHGPGHVCGSTPEVLIAAIATQTKKIRVGSGAILLNHYSPYKVAQVFTSLADLFPNRIDLGIGRATVGPILDLALQKERNRITKTNSRDQILELVAWLDSTFPLNHPFRTYPLKSANEPPELLILGSSLWSAILAGQLGLRYIYAGFLRPETTKEVFDAYYRNFIPSENQSGVKEPYIGLGLSIMCADNEKDARKQFAPLTHFRNQIENGVKTPKLYLPEESMTELKSVPTIEYYHKGSCVPPRDIVGSFEQIQQQIHDIQVDLGFNEIVIKDFFTDIEAKRHSYKLLARLL